MNIKTIHVVAGVITRDELVFIAKRNPGGPAGCKWEFPGGKVEACEEPRQALVRELIEELGVEVSVGEQLGVFETQVGEKIIALDCYWATTTNDDINLTSHSESRWVERSELARMDFASPDIPAIAKILSCE